MFETRLNSMIFEIEMSRTVSDKRVSLEFAPFEPIQQLKWIGMENNVRVFDPHFQFDAKPLGKLQPITKIQPYRQPYVFKFTVLYFKHFYCTYVLKQ
jgi:hypothetical protein